MSSPRAPRPTLSPGNLQQQLHECKVRGRGANPAPINAHPTVVLAVMVSIPVVDVSELSAQSVQESPNLLQQVDDAFRTVGFVFVCGHGIPREMVG